MTLITSPSDTIYEAASSPLKHTISDSASVASKTAAVHALGACTFYGGASEDEILENMSYFLDIVSSDGETISALDAPEPVTAALEEWGFLSTLIDDLSLESEEAIETFTDQLSSSDPAVQIAAGENIALLYEKSYRPVSTDDDDTPDVDPSRAAIISDPDDFPGAPKVLQSYSPYHNTAQLTHPLRPLLHQHAPPCQKGPKGSTDPFRRHPQQHRTPHARTAVPERRQPRNGKTLRKPHGRQDPSRRRDAHR